MRRRIGAPSNHLESAGQEMSERNHPTADEAAEYASGAGSARIPMGQSPSASPSAGTLIPKKSTQAADPTAGGKANRVNIERVGATYRVNAKFTPTIDPAAGATMANARIIPSVQGRVNPNFDGGIQASSL
jgi:hypothetical protein